MNNTSGLGNNNLLNSNLNESEKDSNLGKRTRSDLNDPNSSDKNTQTNQNPTARVNETGTKLVKLCDIYCKKPPENLKRSISQNPTSLSSEVDHVAKKQILDNTGSKTSDDDSVTVSKIQEIEIEVAKNIVKNLDLNKTDGNNRTPLMNAVHEGKIHLVNAILEKMSFSNQQEDPIESFLSRPQLNEVKDNNNKTVFDLAIQSRNQDVLKRLYLTGQFPLLDYVDAIDSVQVFNTPIGCFAETQKFTYMVLTEHILENSTYQGLSTDVVLRNMSIILSDPSIKDDVIKHNLVEKYLLATVICDEILKCKNSLDAITLATKIAIIIAKFKPKDSLLLPGGWSGSNYSGHTMYYEIIKEEDNTYTFYIFNSGRGIVLGHKQKFRGDKSLYQQAMKIVGLPKDQVCNLEFLKGLIELLSKPKYQKRTQEPKPEDFYSKFVPYLLRTGKLAEIPETEIPYSTPQRSGSCAWSSLVPHLRKELGQDYYAFRDKFNISLLNSVLLSVKQSISDESMAKIQDKSKTLEKCYFAAEAIKNACRRRQKYLVRNIEASNVQFVPDHGQALINLAINKLLSTEQNLPALPKISSISEIHYPFPKLGDKNPITASKMPILLDNTPLVEKITKLEEWGALIVNNHSSTSVHDQKKFLRFVEQEFMYLSIYEFDSLNYESFANVVRLATHYKVLSDNVTPESMLTFVTLHIGAVMLANKKVKIYPDYEFIDGSMNFLLYNGFFLLKDPRFEKKREEVRVFNDMIINGNSLKEKAQGLFFDQHENSSVDVYLRPQDSTYSRAIDTLSGYIDEKNLKKVTTELQAKYNKLFRANSSLPIITNEALKVAVFLSDLGDCGVIQEPLLSLKRLAFLSHMDCKNEKLNGVLEIILPKNALNSIIFVKSVSDKLKNSFFKITKTYQIPDFAKFEREESNYKNENWEYRSAWKSMNLSKSTAFDNRAYPCKPEYEVAVSYQYRKGILNSMVSRALDLIVNPSLNGQRLQFILNTLGTRPDLLDRLSFQKHFEIFAFFNKSGTSDEIARNPSLEAQVAEFLQTGFDYFTTHLIEPNYQGALYFIELATHFSKYFTSTSSAKPFSTFYQNVEKTLDAWLSQSKDPSLTTLFLVYKSLLIGTKEDLSDEDVTTILMAAACNRTYSFPEALQNDQIICQFERFHIAKENLIRKWFENNQDKQNELLDKLTLKVSSTPNEGLNQGTWTGTYPKFDKNNTTWFLNDTRFYTDKGFCTTPPEDVKTFAEEKILSGFELPSSFTFVHSTLGTITRSKISTESSNLQPKTSTVFHIHLSDGTYGHMTYLYPNRFQYLAPPKTTLAYTTPNGDTIFKDIKTGSVIYAIQNKIVKKFHNNNVVDTEGNWERVQKFLPSLRTVTDLNDTFLFQKEWIFPKFLMNNGEFLIIKIDNDGKFYHEELGELQASWGDGLLFKDAFGKTVKLFPKASFKAPSYVFGETSAFSNTSIGQFNVHIIATDALPKTSEETMFLIEYYIAKRSFAKALDMVQQWHQPKAASIEEARCICNIMEMYQTWPGKHPDHLALLLRLMTKFPFETIATYLYDKFYRPDCRIPEDIFKNCNKWLEPLLGSSMINSQSIIYGRIFDETNPPPRNLFIAKIEAGLKHISIERLFVLLSAYINQRGNVSKRYQLTEDELLSLYSLEINLLNNKVTLPTRSLALQYKFLTNKQWDLNSYKNSCCMPTYLSNYDNADRMVYDNKTKAVLFDNDFLQFMKVIHNKKSSKEMFEMVRNRACLSLNLGMSGQEERDRFLPLIFAYYNPDKVQALSLTTKELQDLQSRAIKNYSEYPGSEEKFFGVFMDDSVCETTLPLPLYPSRANNDHYTWASNYQFTFKNRAIPSDEIALRNEIEELQNQSERLLTEIKKFILTLPSDQKEKSKAILGRLGGQEEPLTLKQLVRLYLQSNAKELVEQTYLNDDELVQLQNKIPEYLEVTTELKLRQKIMAIKTGNDNCSEEKEKELKELYQRRRAYDLTPETVPYLVFEYASGLFLREKQVKMISALAKNQKMCHQMAMGGGKTKVLLPILAYLKANMKDLPIIVVPESLYTTNLHDLAKTSFDLFGQQGTAFHWDRNTPISDEYLVNKFNELKTIIKNRGYIITTPTSIQSLFLRYIEMKERKSNDDQNVVSKLVQILQLFVKHGNAIVDEFDTVVDARKEVIYAGGSPIHLEQAQLELVKNLYNDIIESNLVKLRENQQYLLSKEDLEKLKTLLLQKNKKVNMSSLLKEQVESIIPLTLSKRGGENYGLSIKQPDKLYVIPYSAVQKPKENSEFGNPLETLNYSFQYYLAKGVTKEQAHDWLKKLHAACNEEAANKEILFYETKISQEIGELLNQPFANFKGECGAEAFYNAINNSHKAILKYVTDVVAPQITSYPNTLVSNAHTFMSLFKVVQGITGTPYNHETYPHDMTLIHDEDEVKQMMTKVTSEIGNKKVVLLKGAKVADVFSEVPHDNNLRAFIDAGAFFEGFNGRDIALELIEYFENNPQGKIQGIKGVLFFEGDQLCLMDTCKNVIQLRTSDPKDTERLGYTRDTLFTFYDQSHTTGVDIPQKEKASAVLFVGRLNLERDIRQAIGRMRGIMSGQSVILAMNEREGRAICSEPTFNDVSRHAEKLQIEYNMEANCEAIQHQIQSVIVKALLKETWSEDNTVDLKYIDKFFFKLIEALSWIIQKPEKKKKSAPATGGTESTPQKIFKSVVDTLTSEYDNALFQLTDDQRSYLNHILTSMKDSISAILNYSKNITLPSSTKVKVVRSSEVTKQVEREVEKNKSLQRELDSIKGYDHRCTARLEPKNIISFNEVQSWSDLEKIVLPITIQPKASHISSPETIFSKNLYVSPNAICKTHKASVCSVPYHAGSITAHYIIGIKTENNQYSYTLLAIQDFAALIKKPPKDSFIFSGNNGNAVYVSEGIDFKSISKSPEFSEILVQNLFISCNVKQLAKKQFFSCFEKWFLSPGTFTRLKILEQIFVGEVIQYVDKQPTFQKLLASAREVKKQK